MRRRTRRAASRVARRHQNQLREARRRWFSDMNCLPRKRLILNTPTSKAKWWLARGETVQTAAKSTRIRRVTLRAIERTYKHTTPSNECSALRNLASENTPLGLPPLTRFPASQSCPSCLRASEPPSSLRRPASASNRARSLISPLRVPLNAVLIFRLCELG